MRESIPSRPLQFWPLAVGRLHALSFPNSKVAVYAPSDGRDMKDREIDSGLVRVVAETDKTASFCLQQNYIDLVKKLTIENGTTERIQDLVVRITSEPEFVVPWEGRIASIRC